MPGARFRFHHSERRNSRARFFSRWISAVLTSDKKLLILTTDYVSQGLFAGLRGRLRSPLYTSLRALRLHCITLRINFAKQSLPQFLRETRLPRRLGSSQ